MSNLRRTLITATAGLAALGIATSVALAQGGMMGQGQGMGPGMMGPGMQQMPGMPGQGMGMMGQGTMGGQGPGMRVTPSQHLTTDDVSHFLGHFLQRHNNPRLKVGAVQEVDEDTIVAEIVTVDDSLVQRWRVDRHTGQMVADSAEQAQPAN
ncbi:MAG TPA: hypothetical protein VLC52_03760 [Anaerolineae bacterium]|nr:hypothetical protein [Anaerolineae bacterium]